MMEEGVLMPDYEELYNDAKQKYFNAIDERDTLRKNKKNLEQQQSQLSKELNQKQNNLNNAQGKKKLIKEALDKCKNILENEFKEVKNNIGSASKEYLKIISADTKVADINSIYDSDFKKTENALSNIKTDLNSKLKTLETEEQKANKEVSDCQNKLNSVNTSLKNVGDEWYANRKVDSCYTQMKTYEQKWLNGE